MIKHLERSRSILFRVSNVKKGNTEMKKITWAFILLVIILISTLSAGCQSEKEPAKTGDLGTESQSADGIVLDSKAGQVYKVGDIIGAGNTILVVLGWDLYPGGSQFPPQEGHKHFALDVMLANQGKDPFDFSPGNSMTLKDLSGNVYYMNSFSGYVTGNISPAGEIIPGEILRGMVGFQVPEDQVEFVLILEPDQHDLGEISVNLGSTPVSLAPPTNLNLSIQQKIYQIGDSAEILGQIIQVIGVAYPADEEITRPQEGFKSIVVDLQVENQGDGTLYFTGSNQMYLKDSTGQKYSDDPLALPAGSDDHVIGSLEPGESIRGQMAFLIPEDAGGLIFIFDPDMFEFGKVFISLD